MTFFKHTQFVFEEKEFSVEEFCQLQGLPVWTQTVQNQVIEFLSEHDEMAFRTSGSTGTPKTIQIQKNYLIASAKKTLDFFELHQGSSALLLLPAQFIGGTMMLIRAMVGGLRLHLVEPKLRPHTVPKVDFLPCTPSQFMSMLNAGMLTHFGGQILLGGAPMPAGIDVGKLRVFEGYGMTETASHIALRPYGNQVFQALPGVELSAMGDALEITADHLGIQKLTTNDAVELVNTKAFKLLGRLDDVINSGGLKIHPVQLEQLLLANGMNELCISCKEDPILGDQLVVVHTLATNQKKLRQAINILPRLQRPKWRFSLEEIPVLPSGKLDRMEVRRLIRAFPHHLSQL